MKNGCKGINIEGLTARIVQDKQINRRGYASSTIIFSSSVVSCTADILCISSP